MRFYNKQHQFYAGIDLHARQMFICCLPVLSIPMATPYSTKIWMLIPHIYFVQYNPIKTT